MVLIFVFLVFISQKDENNSKNNVDIPVFIKSTKEGNVPAIIHEKGRSTPVKL